MVRPNLVVRRWEEIRWELNDPGIDDLSGVHIKLIHVALAGGDVVIGKRPQVTVVVKFKIIGGVIVRIRGRYRDGRRTNNV